MILLESILKKYNCPKRQTLIDNDFSEIENQIGFKLPEDYKIFLRNYLFFETQIGFEGFKLWEYEKLLDLNTRYSVIKNLNKTIAIGDNGGGELIGIEELSDMSKRVILTPFIDLDKEYHIEIGISFTDFFIRMDRGEKWFK